MAAALLAIFQNPFYSTYWLHDASVRFFRVFFLFLLSFYGYIFLCVVIVPVRVSNKECVEHCCVIKLVATFHTPVGFHFGPKVNECPKRNDCVYFVGVRVLV